MAAAEVEVPASPRALFPLLLVLVLSLSALVQLTGLTRTVVDSPLSADAGDYFSYAYNLHEHGVFSRAATWLHPSLAVAPDKVRSPGYPVFLLLAGAPHPDAAWAFRVFLLQAGLAVGVVLLTYLVGTRLAGRPLALVAALLVAINPFIANSAVYLLTETLFTFLLLASTALSLAAMRQRGRWPWAVAAGAAWAACSLVRPTTEFLLPALLVATLLVPAWQAWRKPALVATIAFAVAMAPWLWRNHSVPATPGENLMVNSIVHGSYPGFMYEDDPRSYAFPYRYDPQVAAIEHDLGSALRHVAAGFRERPLRFAQWYLLGKPYFFLSLEDVQSRNFEIYAVSASPWYQDRRFVAAGALSRALHWPLTIAALLALLALAWRPAWLRLPDDRIGAAAVVALVVVYAIALHMVVAPFPRYGIPFRPLIYLLGLLAFRAAWRLRPGAAR